MNKISCDVCLDLMPLVKDGVASEDSKLLVLEHIKECEFCREEFENSDMVQYKIDDNKVLKKLKKQLYTIALTIIIIGTLFGIGVTETAGMLYNVIIMPIIGAISYYALKKTAYYVPIVLFILSYLWTFIKYSSENILVNPSIITLLISPLPWSVIYSVLCLIGIIISFLLKFAFEER